MKLLTVKAEDADYESWKQAAERAGMDLSAWIRGLANGASDGKDVRADAGVPVVERGTPAAKRRKSEFAEDVARRTRHEVGCDCFQCVQAERFFRTQRRG